MPLPLITDSRMPTLASLLYLVGLVGLSACSKPKQSNPPVKTPEWQGLRMGTPRQDAEKRLRDAKLRVSCLPAQNVTFLENNALYTRWIKPGKGDRIVRCTARRKKGAKPGPDGVLHTKLYFLDGKLFRLHVKILSTDLAFDQLLRARYGVLRQQMIARHAYASPKPTMIRMWTLARASTRLIWLRAQRQQQLIWFTTDPARIKTLKALSSTRKGN